MQKKGSRNQEVVKLHSYLNLTLPRQIRSKLSIPLIQIHLNHYKELVILSTVTETKEAKSYLDDGFILWEWKDQAYPVAKAIC
jgi:hypothetical protein